MRQNSPSQADPATPRPCLLPLFLASYFYFEVVFLNLNSEGMEALHEELRFHYQREIELVFSFSLLQIFAGRRYGCKRCVERPFDVSSSEFCVSGMRKHTLLPPCLNFSVMPGSGLLRREVAYRYRPTESFLSSSVILFPKNFFRENPGDVRLILHFNPLALTSPSMKVKESSQPSGNGKLHRR